MSNAARETLSGDELPGRLAAQLGDGQAGDVYLVEARRLSSEDAAKLAALRADIQTGIDQLDAGLGKPLDVRGLIERLKAETSSTHA